VSKRLFEFERVRRWWVSLTGRPAGLRSHPDSDNHSFVSVCNLRGLYPVLGSLAGRTLALVHQKVDGLAISRQLLIGTGLPVRDTAP